jgi:hypothetical protein
MKTKTSLPRLRAVACLLWLLLVLTGCSLHETPPPPGDMQVAAMAFEAVRNDPVRLRAFLSEFPKGGELHSHHSGAVYAEDLLQWSRDSNLCISTTPPALSDPPCAPGTEPATKALKNATLFNRLVDLFSNRNFDNSRAMWGHDHFFATFDHFDKATGQTEKILAELMKEAGRHNALYLELMKCYFPPQLWTAAAKAGWDGDPDATLKRLEQTGLFATIPAMQKRIDEIEAEAAQLVAGTPGQDVTVRWLEQCIRILPPEAVFAQFAYAFALCRADARVVGFNLVAPEDHPVAMRDYALHMRMIQALRKHFPETNVSLHAGELRLGLVKPEGLRSHIRQAVEVAGSKRIGHGVDLAFEKDIPGLLKEMRKRRVSVEICLSSNEQILGVSGAEHPVRTYMAAQIPVTLNTDDAGVARIDLPHEYQKAVLEHHFDFADLVRVSRNVLEYSFLPGQSLWRNPDAFTPVDACADDLREDTIKPSPSCAAMLHTSEKATLQWELEKRFRAFNRRAPKFVELVE